MKLRAIEIRNWGCIASLSLVDLRDGIIVLHGPNQTGKSTLVEAIRCCLFDLDHNSTSQRLSAAVPLRAGGTPQVTIEFMLGPQRYRVAKAFSKNKEGFAKIEQQGPAGWKIVEEGKEANRKIREILGVEKSSHGLFQLLWLPQGDIRLPDKPDPILVKSLEGILGSMITGRDLDFKRRLDKACERWFTPTTMKDKVGSPVTRAETDLQAARAAQTEIDRQWAEAEATLQRYDEALARQPVLQQNLDASAAELERVHKERDSITARRSRHELAVKHRDAEDRQLRQALQRLRDTELAESQHALAAKTLAQTHLQLQIVEESWRQTQTRADQCRQQLDDCERALALHQQTRPSVEDRHQLLQLATQRQGLDQTLAQVREWSQAQAALEARLVGPAHLTQTEIEQLRKNRQEATTLKAQLEAAEIHVTIQARQPFACAIVQDGQPGSAVSLAGMAEHRWLIRQQAEFTLGDWATVRVGRGQQDQRLEELAERLTELDRVYRTRLAAAGADPDEPTALDLLFERRLEHESRSAELQRLREAIARSAPQGLAALEAQRNHLREQADAILARRSELRDWVPNQPEFDQHKSAFDQHESDLRSNREQAKQGFDRAVQSAAERLAALQEIRDQIVSQTVEVRTLQEKAARYDRAGLQAAVEEARNRLAEAQAKVQESTLTEAEQAIETRYQSARAAQSSRSERVRNNEILLTELRTRLNGAEGLHQKRIQAEQEVSDRTREYERERLHAQAHKHLKTLFEEVRQEQVRRTVGPINDRVMSWAKQLGLTDYAGLSFGDQLLPGGLVPTFAADGEPVGLERESYGTVEQLSLLIRLAVGGLLAREGSAVAILDDPLAHADLGKHRKMLDILARSAHGEPNGPHPTGPLQLLILTCHEERFDHLIETQRFDLAGLIRRGG